MRIIEIELKNHIVIGDIHVKTDNEINAFIGVNGSGKSILLSTLQPFGTSDRYSLSYPIIPNKNGYKRIVYNVNGVIYETIHEYIPNKQKHSCKSYLNRIVNDIKEELNPNGHVNIYEDLVAKHLNFTRDVLDICYITSKADGLTSAPPKRRKEILEVTNASSILLKDYQKIINELVKDNKAISRILGEKRVSLLNNKSEGILADEIQFNEQELNKLQELCQNDINTKIKLLSELDSINKLDITKSDMELISNIITLLNKYQKDTLLEIKEMYNTNTSQIEKTTLEISFLEKEHTEYTLKEQKAKELEYLNSELNTQVALYKKCENILNQIFISTDYKELIEVLNIIKREYIPLINYIISYDVTFHNLLNRYSIDKLYDMKKLELDDVRSFVAVYNAKLEDSNSSVNFNINDIDVQDNCKKCPLYSKMVLSTEYIQSNKTKYEESKELIISLESDLRLIDKILNAEENNTNIIKSLIEKLSDNGKNKTGFDISIIKMYKNNKQYNEIIDYLLETINNYYNSKAKIDNIHNQIKINEVSSIHEIKTKLNTIANEIQSLKNNNREKVQWIYNYNNDNINNLIATNNSFITKNKMSLEAIQNQFQNKYQLILDIENKIKSVEQDIIIKQTRIDELKNKIILDKNNLNELRVTLKSLLDVAAKGEYYKNIKVLLEKDIPILLLQSQLEFIQYQTNQILEDNEIDIQIEITSNGSDIIIPAYINGRINPDIRNVSQGESCLISLLINACMAHILGYNIIYLDEIDANLDTINRDKFNNIIYSILSHLNIDQIFCISHNVANSVESAQLYALGKSWRNLNFGRTSQVIEL